MATLSPNEILGHPSRRPDLGALVSCSKAIRLDSRARYLPSLGSTKDAACLGMRYSADTLRSTHGFPGFPGFPK
jgi:hypothetical protein